MIKADVEGCAVSAGRKIIEGLQEALDGKGRIHRVPRGKPLWEILRDEAEMPEGWADQTRFHQAADTIEALCAHLEWLLESYDLGVIGADRTQKLLSKALGNTGGGHGN